MFKKRQSPLNVSFLYLRGENVTHSFAYVCTFWVQESYCQRGNRATKEARLPPRQIYNPAQCRQNPSNSA